jgi:hypothetical protein
VDVLDRLGLGQVSRSLLPCWWQAQPLKRSPRKSASDQLQVLDLRAHGAVEHEDALARGL